MNFAEGILCDLAEADAYEKWRRLQAAPASNVGQSCLLEPSDARKLALLRSEILNVGMSASVIASLANAAESQLFPELSNTSVLGLMPIHSATFEADIYELSGNAEFFGIVQLVQALLARLSLAHNLSKAFPPGSGGFSVDKLCPVEVIADSWRRVCKASIEAHQAIAETMSSAGHVCPVSVEASTLELLRSASWGGWPCINREGFLSIPGWAERRIESRVQVGIAVMITFGPARFPAIIDNATPTGFGLTTAMVVRTGAEIGVHLPDGRSVTSIVRWANSGKLGVRLLEPLAPDDPLLRGESA